MKLFTNMTSVQKKAMVALAIICTGNYMGGLYRTCMPYIVNQYLALGYDEMSIQRLMSIGAYVSLPFGFAIGPLAMKFNKKYLMTIAMSTMACHYAIFYFAGLTAAPLWVLYAGVISAGICQGTGLALVNSTISEYFEQEKRATYNANFTALMSSGSMIANVVGGNIAAANGGTTWYNAFTLGFWLIIITVIFFILMPKSPDDEQMEKNASKVEPAKSVPQVPEADLLEWEKKFIPAKTFGLICCGIMTSFAITANMNSLSLFIVRDYALGTTAESGLSASMNQFTSLTIGFTYAFWGKLLGRYIHIIGVSIIACGYFMIYMWGPTNLYVVYAGAISISLGFNLLNPYYMGRIMYCTPKKWLPVALSLSNVGIQLATAVALDIFNYVSNLFGTEGKYKYLSGGLATCLVIVVAFFVYFVWKSPREKEELAAVRAGK